MEATDEPFTMSYELMCIHQMQSILCRGMRSIIIHLRLNRSSLPIHSATPTTPEGVVTAFMQPCSFR